MSDFMELRQKLREEDRNQRLNLNRNTVQQEQIEEELSRDLVLNTELPEAGTYTEDDLATNDAAYKIVSEHMMDRFGLQSVENKTREEVVSQFINNRRGVAGGNTVRGLKEFDFLNDIKNDQVKMARTGRAYQLFENMAGLYSDQTTTGEKIAGTWDYARSGILDPVNLLGGWVGKAVGNGSVKVGLNVAQKAAIKAMQDAAKKGATKEATSKAGQEAFKMAVKQANAQTINNARAFTQKMLSDRGFKKLAQKGALREIGTTVTIEAAASAGMDALYQNGLIMTDVQDEFSYGQMGIATLGSLIIGGATAGRVMMRGEVGPKSSPLTASTKKQKQNVLTDLTEELNRYATVQASEKWSARVAKGQELESQDSQFFIELLLGRNDADGNILFEGISQKAAKNGVYWLKESDDNVGNWVAEIISSSSQKQVDEFVKAFNKATGNTQKVTRSKKSGVKGMTPDDLANTFANKISQSARNLNALKQVADRNSLSLEDLDLKMFLADSADLPYNLVPREVEEVKPSIIQKFTGKIPDTITNTQNKIIRLLVSNPSTSALNVIGWGANTSLSTVSDMSLAVLYATKGGLQRALMQKEAGQESMRIGRQLMNTSFFKARSFLDPSMSRAHFETMLARNTKAMDELNSTLPGGVDNASRLLTDGEFSSTARMIDLRTEQMVDAIQAVTLVKTQDRFTKSVEFLSQMDKALRLKFDKGWDEFYSSPNASAVMKTKEYLDMEAMAVKKTQEAIFSKSYKSNTGLGQLAGFIEDARNIPGIGLMVPFGRFFNNTVDFAVQASGMSVIAKTISRNYADKSYGELATKAAVSYGLVYSMTETERENRKQGLGLYQTVVDGEVINQQFDYPISLFKAAARLASYYRDNESPPPELLGQIARDFTLEGVLRNLDQSQKDVATMTYHVFSMELEEARKAAGKAFGGIGSQAISASTRFIEPVNVIAGVVNPDNARPIDRYQGNKFANDAFRYFDNIIPLFTGQPRGETLQSAAGGEADVTSTKVMGIRPIRLTQTQRVMNMMGLDTFRINEERKVRSQSPKAANEYNRVLFDVVETKSTALMNNKAFRKMNTSDQRMVWNKVLRNSKDAAREFVVLQLEDSDPVVRYQYQITKSFSRKEIDDARQELELTEDLDELNINAIRQLQEYLKVKKTLDAIRINQVMTEN